MLQTVRLGIGQVNPHLTCVLCGGYFIDATTITECLHSFCKKCILVYLETSKCCPICDTQVHQTKSLLNLRPDKTLQDIVYKLVPGLYKNEMKQRREFYFQHSEEDPISREDGGDVRDRIIFDANHKISLCLKYTSYEDAEDYLTTDLDHNSSNSDVEKEACKRTANSIKERFLLCPAAVSIAILRKLIVAKFGLTEDNKIEIMHSGEVLHEQMTLSDVAYTYCWEESEPLVLRYRISEKNVAKPATSVDGKNCTRLPLPDGHTVTSSGRKVKTLCYTETRPAPVRHNHHYVKKRKHSGSGGGAAGGISASRVSKKVRMEPLTNILDNSVPKSSSKVATDVGSGATNSTHTKIRIKNKCDRRKERCSFDSVCDKSERSAKRDYNHGEVPHIAIKISKTGDTKDGWSSQPCQISNSSSRNKSRSSSLSEPSKDLHHRRETEEDSGRGSDVSSPSLLSPSNTDPSMSPPGNMMTPPHDRSPISPIHRSSNEYASQKSRTKSTSDACAFRHKDGRCGSSSVPNSPCHESNGKDLLTPFVELSKLDKLHKKRAHKYSNSLSVKVPDQHTNKYDFMSGLALGERQYSNVMASIPSPENPLLMKITRQIAAKPITGEPSPKMASSPARSSTCSEETVHPVPKSDAPQLSLPSSKPVDCATSQDVSDAGEPSTPKQVDDSVQEAASSETPVHSIEADSSEIQSCTPEVNGTVPGESDDKNEPRSENNDRSEPNPKPDDQEHNSTEEQQNSPEPDSSCSRVLPFDKKLKRGSTNGVGPSPSTERCTSVDDDKPLPESSDVYEFQDTPTTTTTTTSTSNIESDGSCSTTTTTNSSTVTSLSSNSVGSTSKITKSKNLPAVRPSSPAPNSLDDDLQALPSLRIPRFIPQTTWYNLPTNSVSINRFYKSPDFLSTSTGSSCSPDHVRTGLAVSTTSVHCIDGIRNDGITDNDRQSHVAIRHKTPQQVKRPIIGIHHVSPQPMMIQDIRRERLFADRASHVKITSGPTMPALWRFPGYPPY